MIKRVLCDGDNVTITHYPNGVVEWAIEYRLTPLATGFQVDGVDNVFVSTSPDIRVSGEVEDENEAAKVPPIGTVDLKIRSIRLHNLMQADKIIVEKEDGSVFCFEPGEVTVKWLDGMTITVHEDGTEVKTQGSISLGDWHSRMDMLKITLINAGVPLQKYYS